MAENKVRFGLKNVNYALVNEDALTGEVTFETPKPFKGAVNLTIDPRGEQAEFYADNMAYYVTYVNNGYEGTYECAEVPLAFKTEVLGDTLTPDGALIEKTDAKIKRVALMFEFDGDIKATRHVLYSVDFTRGGLSGGTTTDTTEPQTTELSFVAGQGFKGMVKASTTATMSDALYDAWYDSVFIPTDAPPVPVTTTTTKKDEA